MFRLVLAKALRLVLIGVGTGLVAAALLTRLLETLLFESRAARSADVRAHRARLAAGRDGRVVRSRAAAAPSLRRWRRYGPSDVEH